MSIRAAILTEPYIGSVKQQLGCVVIWHCMTMYDLGKAQPKYKSTCTKCKHSRGDLKLSDQQLLINQCKQIWKEPR